MTTEQIIGLLLALLVMLVGLGGTMIPGVPGVPLVLLAAGAHRLWFGDAGVSNAVLVILTLLTLVSLGVDYLASVLGARKLGATWRGVLGAVLGATVGIFFAIPGVIIGPFVGAVAFEMLGGREWKEATRAGVGALVGVFVGVLGKVVCCAVMIGLFAVSVVARSAASPL
ncbi:MAG: DUF456 domain-containing protein [Verrucomicrobia bacterium]|nr:DUF456 domain-containing protein [Verrucomicrobiota bacterium]